MTEQRVNWAEATPERNRSFWRTYLYGHRGSLWVSAALGVLALFSFFYLKDWVLAVSLLTGIVVFLLISLLSYRAMRRFSSEIGLARYSLDGHEWRTRHQLAEVAVPLQNMSKVIPFLEGIHVQYGKRLMLTLPDGPVQAALVERLKGATHDSP